MTRLWVAGCAISLLLPLSAAAAAQDRVREPFPRIETGARVVAPPDGVHPFYAKYINAGGVLIVSSDAVPDAALLAAYRTILHLTAARPDILQAMLPNNPRISILGVSETASDLPEFGPISDGQWGLGQMLGDPTSLVSVRGVCYTGNAEYRANFLLHEFVHVMQNLGWPTTEPTAPAAALTTSVSPATGLPSSSRPK